MPKKPNRYTIKKVTRFRSPKTGRFQKRRKTSIEEVYETQYTEKGQKLRTARAYKQGKIVTVNVDETDGSVSRALNRKGWLAVKNYKGAKQIVITIKGKDYRDKEKRIKGIIDLDKGEQNIGNVITGRIIGLIHDRGYRPQYSLNIVDWSKTKASKNFSRTKKQLHDLNITIEVRK
ncbi:MAG: hypothetical protein EO766_16620 [Hydrotalea sp. AMD]|uniref:hypothetical protein n=1 Tax=Hydrotalea sp. AMD TaxID=2501297 RepID=UPI001025C5F3|nr:hypothetical protein [Hydrotalea sp. AMD]RWZ85535.1 MAG: hypothetical protein EO766_16620 [Hydrotalea sp. AMD]